MSIHPNDIAPLTQMEAAIFLKEKPNTFEKQVKAGNWDGAYYMCGDEKRFTLQLIAETQARKAREIAQ